MSNIRTSENVSLDSNGNRVQGAIPPANKIIDLLSWIILLCGISTIAVTAYVTLVSYSALPYSDGWREIDPVAWKSNPLDPVWLWAQNNEHRLVIPKLFLATDLSLFHARQTFLLVSVFVIQLLHLSLLAWSMRVLGSWTGGKWRTGVGIAAFCLFCPSQWENFVWGFQVCFVLPLLFATLSFVVMLLYVMRARQNPSERPSRYVLISAASALAASYSLANGNLLWPLLVAASLVLGLRWSVTLTYAVTGVVNLCLYLYHYLRPAKHAGIRSSLCSPVQLLKYMAAYFGSSWVREGVRPAEIIGSLGLLVAVIAVVWFSRRRGRPFLLQLLLILLFCLFCMGTAFITALGRLNFGVAQAFASRYQTVALLFWCCLALVALQLAFASRYRGRVAVLLQICLLAVAVRSAFMAPKAIWAAREHGFQLNAAAMALVDGVYDESQFFYVALVRPQYLLLGARLLQENRMSIYANDPDLQFGRPVSSLFQIAPPGECSGEIGAVTPITSSNGQGVKITGWAVSKDGKPASEIIVTSGGVVAGFGAVGDWRPADITARAGSASHYIGFIGYALESQRATRLDVYAVSANKRGCLIGSASL